jgi:hypothetical protein
MSKFSTFLCAATLLLPLPNPVGGRFEKYKAIEAYEILPGILAMPAYSTDGQVCEIGLERRHYSPDKIELDSGLTREEIDRALDELAPLNERGNRSKEFEKDLITQNGNAITTSIDYENVLLQIYGEGSHATKGKVIETNIAATIRWKNRKCE